MNRSGKGVAVLVRIYKFGYKKVFSHTLRGFLQSDLHPVSIKHGVSLLSGFAG
jgi:hypothetical protein